MEQNMIIIIILALIIAVITGISIFTMTKKPDVDPKKPDVDPDRSANEKSYDKLASSLGETQENISLNFGIATDLVDSMRKLNGEINEVYEKIKSLINDDGSDNNKGGGDKNNGNLTVEESKEDEDEKNYNNETYKDMFSRNEKLKYDKKIIEDIIVVNEYLIKNILQNKINEMIRLKDQINDDKGELSKKIQDKIRKFKKYITDLESDDRFTKDLIDMNSIVEESNKILEKIKRYESKRIFGYCGPNFDKSINYCVSNCEDGNAKEVCDKYKCKKSGDTETETKNKFVLNSFDGCKRECKPDNCFAFSARKTDGFTEAKDGEKSKPEYECVLAFDENGTSYNTEGNNTNGSIYAKQYGAIKDGVRSSAECCPKLFPKKTDSGNAEEGYKKMRRFY